MTARFPRFCAVCRGRFIRHAAGWRAFICGFLLFPGGLALAQAGDPLLYENDFEKADVGKVPEDMLVLDGNFAVREDGGNKFLELPGAPLDSYSVQFGPAETNSVSVSAIIRSSAKGRRFPVFGVGLYGVAGFRLQVSAGKKSLELYKDQTLLAAAAWEWKSGEWTELRLRAIQGADGTWKAEGKAWGQGSPEPAEWMIAAEHKPESPLSGRASAFGSPFAGTSIQFDDFKVRKADAR